MLTFLEHLELKEALRLISEGDERHPLVARVIHAQISDEWRKILRQGPNLPRAATEGQREQIKKALSIKGLKVSDEEIDNSIAKHHKENPPRKKKLEESRIQAVRRRQKNLDEGKLQYVKKKIIRKIDKADRKLGNTLYKNAATTLGTVAGATAGAALEGSVGAMAGGAVGAAAGNSIDIFRDKLRRLRKGNQNK